MNSPSHDLALYLQAEGVGTFGGNTPWSIHVGGEPATPDNCVTLYDTPGLGPDTDEQDMFQPSFQVRVRSLDYRQAYDRQELIRDLLIMPIRITLETSEVVLITMTSDIASLGRDSNQRYLLTANYRAIRQSKEH